MMDPAVNASDHTDRRQFATEVLKFAREELGPVSEQVLSNPAVQALVRSRIRGGAEQRDAVLALVHAAAPKDPRVADEFMAYFMRAMLRMGRGSLAPGLRRFLETGDLVQSVLGDLWPELASLKFETRAQFLSLLAQRMRWKASDRNREMHGQKRREDRRVNHGPEDLQISTGKPSPRSLAGDEEERQRLALALLRLSERDRRILTLYLRGRTVDEIAKELELEMWATRKALQRAMQRARDLAD